MQSIIDYYFSMSSPWAYIGFGLFKEITHRHGLAINYRPMVLRDVFDKTGGLPLAQRHPARQRYRMVELQRWRDYRGLDFNLKPAFSPFDARLLDGTVIAIVKAGGDPAGFISTAHRAVWEGEQDLADEAIIRTLLEVNSFQPSQILAAAREQATVDIYAANHDAAIEAGIFGAPSYVFEGEVFWGQDRLELLDHRLKTGRPAFLPV